MTNFLKKEIRLFEATDRNSSYIYHLRAFFAALIIAVLMFIPMVETNGGIFIFYGDYNAQQIPFYTMCVQAVHDGMTRWNWQTSIGGSFVGLYSYYTLGSPFFWFMTLFPVSWTPYLMAPLLCIKFGLISLFAFMYLNRFTKKPQLALISALLYTFSSFNIYNIFFQFQDSYMWFPLMLIGLEEAVLNKRRGIFAFSVALNALANYFFFFGECVFLVMYFICRIAMDKKFRVGLKDFCALAFESVLGVLIAGVLFFPSCAHILQTPRVDDKLIGWDILFYSWNQRYGTILESMFFFPELPGENAMFPASATRWSSVEFYIPLFSMSGIIAFVSGVKKHWAKSLLLLSLVFALIPGLNASFTLFNVYYYTRWFYMPLLIGCLATMYVLEHEELDLMRGFKTCAAVVVLMSLAVTLIPTTKVIEKNKIYLMFETFDDATVWFIIGFTIFFLGALYVVIRMRLRLSGEKYVSLVTLSVMVSSLILGYFVLISGRANGPIKGEYNKTIKSEFKIDDPEVYRIESPADNDNVNMLWGLMSMNGFTSTLNGSVYNLYNTIGIDPSVRFDADISYYAFKALMNVKYWMFPITANREKTPSAVMLDEELFEYFDTQSDYDIFRFKYALPMGFAYDQYFLLDDIKYVHDEDEKKLDKLMVHAAFLNKEQVDEYSDILKPEELEYADGVSIDTFKSDALERIGDGVRDFEITKKGFKANCDYDTERLVVFSVPYDKGWSAEINGKPVKVDCLNGGLCGIRVPEGKCEISFEYFAPGLKLGIISTFAGALIEAAYMLAVFRLRSTKKIKR